MNHMIMIMIMIYSTERVWEKHSHLLLHGRLLLTTLVIACLMITPALSTSFFDKPEVMHTFSAGWSSQPISFAVAFMGRGMLLTRVISTPLAKLYNRRESSLSCA